MSSQARKVVYATGSRADYGIVRRYLSLLDAEPSVDLSVAVTGALLDPTYGSQVSLVESDGFRVSARVPLPLDVSTNVGVAHAMSVALDGFSAFFADDRPDLLIILGDRYEMLSIATAAAMQSIPILHIHGGEATYGNYDEFIRHSITKMSRFHFTATEEYRRRVVQLGEDPSTVFNLGALGAENCLEIEISNVPDVVRSLPERGYLVVLFHPETLSATSPGEQVVEVLASCDVFPEMPVVLIGSNADTHSDEVRAAEHSYVASSSRATYFENLSPDAYHYLVKHSACLVGNSSSGLIEAPSLGAYTVNIGNRQEGRVRGSSVIDAPCNCDMIRAAICRAIASPPLDIECNPYYQPRCAGRYVEQTLDILDLVGTGLTPKRFFDM